MTAPAFVYPGPIYYPVTSPFGPRPAPVPGASTFHQGVDLDYPQGTPVWAAADGTVIYCAYEGGAGNTLTIDHGGGWQTRYHHLERSSVGYGAKVRARQEVGRSDTTGNVGGPHLHFEIRDSPGHPVDPWPYISQGPSGGSSGAGDPDTEESEEVMLIVNKSTMEAAVIFGNHRPRKIPSVNDYHGGAVLICDDPTWDQYWADSIKLHEAALET